MERVAIVIGHRASKQGARSVDWTSEWAWNSAYAPVLADAIRERGIRPLIVTRPDHADGYHQLPGLINDGEPAAVISLHWNASSSRSATGSVVLHYLGSSAGEALARELDTADDVLGLRDRGLGGVLARGWEVILDDGTRHGALVLPGPLSHAQAEARAAKMGASHRAQRQRGTWLLERTAAPAVVLEPAFGTNTGDWRHLNDRREELAQAQAQGIRRWMDAR